MSDEKAKFQNIRRKGLQETKADWEGHYQSLIPFLTNEDAGIRSQCIEGLCTAVFWAEGSGPLNERPAMEHMRKRTDWLLDLFLDAQKTYDDTVSNVLKCMVFIFPKGDGTEEIAFDWLHLLLKGPRPGVCRDVVNGTIVLHQTAGQDQAKQFSEWLELLDNPSDYVRACAAYRIGGACDEGLMPVDALFELIKHKDIQRPGIAGPFWTQAEYDDRVDHDFGMNWMMDILERRSSPSPKDVPFNDIVFHLHEICDHSPDMVRRMIKGGYTGLALETALETRGFVEGMAPVLRDLGWDNDRQVVHIIGRHLACYYQEVHPNADPQDIKRVPDWLEDAELFLLRFFPDVEISDCAVIYCTVEAGHFTDQRAWQIIDKILPPPSRGFLRKGSLAFDDHLPPAPQILGDSISYFFEEHMSVAMHGDPEKRRWSKIIIHSRKLALSEVK